MTSNVAHEQKFKTSLHIPFTMIWFGNKHVVGDLLLDRIYSRISSFKQTMILVNLVIRKKEESNKKTV